MVKRGGFLTLITALLCSGCCGGQLCSTRFDQPMHGLEDVPEKLPYQEPPCGFRTVGGPPNMIPPGAENTPPSHLPVDAPVPKFLPVPTRPVFHPDLPIVAAADPPPPPQPLAPEEGGDDGWLQRNADRLPSVDGEEMEPMDPALPEGDPPPDMDRLPPEMDPAPSPEELPPAGSEPDDSKVAGRPASTSVLHFYRSRLRVVD